MWLNDIEGSGPLLQRTLLAKEKRTNVQVRSSSSKSAAVLTTHLYKVRFTVTDLYIRLHTNPNPLLFGGKRPTSLRLNAWSSGGISAESRNAEAPTAMGVRSTPAIKSLAWALHG